MTIGVICVCISLSFQIAAIVILLHGSREKKRAKVRRIVDFGVYIYGLNVTVNLLVTYAIYSLTANKNINSVLLPAVWLLGNIISGMAVYVSMTPTEWQNELTRAIKYSLLGQCLLLFCTIILRSEIMQRK